MTTTRRIQICLFVIEFVAAVTICYGSTKLFKILPFGGISWTAELILLTLAGLWIIKSTLGAMHSLQHGSVYKNNEKYDIIDDDKNDPLIICHEREGRQAHSTTTNNAGEDKSSTQAQSEIIAETKKSLSNTEISSGGQDTADISFPIMAIFATVVLQCAIRLFVLAQNLRRKFRFKKRVANDSLIQLTDIPFAIGKKISSGGCSFFIFSFLNGWVRCDDNSQANGDNSGVSVDNNMTLQAVSFDQISINSSRILRRSPRQCDDPVDLTNSSIATTQPSWWGFAFGGIEMNFEIHLKKEHRRPGQNVRDDGDTNIRTITITIKVESLQFNILPRCSDWVNVRGIQIDTDATFDTDGSAPFDCSQTNSSGECKTLFGFGMSTAFGQLNMHLFSSKNTTTGLASGNDKRNEVLAWDGAKSSFYLRQFDSSSQNTGNKVLRKKTVASISYPAGFIVVHGSKQKQFETRLASTASPLRQAAIYVGKYANNRDDNSAMGDSSFILGVDLKVLSIFVQSTDVLLQNIAGSVVRDNSSARVHQNAMQIVSNKKTAKKTEKTDVVEFYFISCVHLYALLPTSKNNGTPPFCDNSHANATIMNTLSLRTTLASLQWRKRLQVKSSDESFDGDSFRGYLGIMPQKHYDVSSINLADVRDTSLRYEVFGIGQHDNECAAALSLAVLKRTKAKFIHLSCSENKSALPDNKIRDVVHKSKCMAVDLGSVAVRLNGEVVTHLACIMQTVDGAQVAVTGLQRTSKRIKQIVSNKGGKSSSPDSCVVKQNSFDRVDLSCSCVDAIIDLPIAPDGVNNSYSIECDDAANDQQVRMALLNGKTTVGISKFGGIVNVTPQTTYCGAPGFPDVDETFETELQKNAECYLFEIAISQIEGSVAFFPHASLPVIDRETATIIAPRKKETIFYSHATGLLIKTTSPLNNSQTKNTPLQSPPPTTSKAIAVDFDELSVYERFNEDDQTGSSLFSIPVSEFLLSRNGPGAPADWPMMQTYFENKNSLVKILKCKGKVCMVDRRDIVAGEKSSLVLIKFSESSSSELEIVWSPVFQCLQASCNYRVQEALARLKACLPKKQSNKSGFPCQKTNIRIGVDSLSRAHMHTFLGSRSAMQTVFEGGLDLSISMTKHVPPATTTSKESASKPNITFQAKHVLVLLNGIETPIFTFDSLFVENIIRRANDNEVMEFVRKSDQPIHDLGDFIVTDHDGHPLKEIFELKLGSCTTMKFPPVLHFGGVIDDFLLTPRALDIGLGSLKNSQHKRMKRYQMMSIKCIIPFLDVALMNPSPDAKHHSLIGSYSPPTSQSFLRDELRLCLEAVDVSIERNTPPEITQSQINALDEDDSSIFDFGPSIQGGEIYLTMNHVVCTLHPLNLATPLIRVNDLTVDGILYLAGLSPTTPEIQEGKTITSSLSCHHNFSTNARQCKCCCYGVSFHSTGIPVKLYSDCKVFCEDLDISYGPVLNPSIPRLMECLQRLLPPPPKTVNKQDPPPPISWWDNLRFFVHGPLSLSVNAMAIRWLLDSHTFRDQSIILNCQKCCIDYNLGYFEIDATDLNVSIPGCVLNQVILHLVFLYAFLIFCIFC